MTAPTFRRVVPTGLGATHGASRAVGCCVATLEVHPEPADGAAEHATRTRV